MKKLIIVTMITACVALCAAVWPHGNAVEETPVPAAETAVSAKEATVAEIEEPATLAEKEKRTIPRQEVPQDEQPEPEIGPIETPVASELQPSTGRASAKNSAPEPIIVKTAQTFTKTATKLGSWGEICGKHSK